MCIILERSTDLDTQMSLGANLFLNTYFEYSVAKVRIQIRFLFRVLFGCSDSMRIIKVQFRFRINQLYSYNHCETLNNLS